MALSWAFMILSRVCSSVMNVLAFCTAVENV